MCVCVCVCVCVMCVCVYVCVCDVMWVVSAGLFVLGLLSSFFTCPT